MENCFKCGKLIFFKSSINLFENNKIYCKKCYQREIDIESMTKLVYEVEDIKFSKNNFIKKNKEDIPEQQKSRYPFDKVGHINNDITPVGDEYFEKLKNASPKVHQLQHIELNPNYSPEDPQASKYLFIYKLGNGQMISSDKYLDATGQPTHKLPSFLDQSNGKQKIFMRGELVKGSDGNHYMVISHLDPNNLANALVEGDKGQKISVPRNNIQLAGADYSNSTSVQTADGQRKFLHDLQDGDKIRFDNSNHEVTGNLPGLGLTTKDENGKLRLIHESHFDKNYGDTFEKQYPRKGNMVRFTDHTGTSIKAKIIEIDREIGTAILEIPNIQSDKKLVKVKIKDIENKVIYETPHELVKIESLEERNFAISGVKDPELKNEKKEIPKNISIDEIEIILNTQINIIDGFEFEKYLEKLLTALDFEVIRTKSTRDKGADLILKKNQEIIIVQAKRLSSKVSIKAVQEIVAAKNHYKADKCIIITNNQFTHDCIVLAKSNNVELWDGEILKEKIKYISSL